MGYFRRAILELFEQNPWLRIPLWLVLSLPVVVTVYTVLRPGIAVTEPVGWERTIGLSPLRLQVAQASAVNLGTVVAIASEAREEGVTSVYLARSLDGGASFSDPLKLAEARFQDGDALMAPHAAISPGGELAVVWQEFDPEKAVFSVGLTLSRDMGANWLPSRSFLFSGEMNFRPGVWYDNRGVLHIFYHAVEEAGIVLYHVTSADGVQFDEPEAVMSLSGDMRGQFFPAVLFDNNRVFMVWQSKDAGSGGLSDDLYYMDSDNYGKSWSSPFKLTLSAASDSSPALALAGDVLYCVYQNNEKNNWRIKCLRGRNYGENWDVTPLDVFETEENCYNPVVAYSSGMNRLVFGWHDNSAGYYRVYCRYYNPLTQEFGEARAVSEEKVGAAFPGMLGMPWIILCVWQQGTTLAGRFADVQAPMPVVTSPTHPLNGWSDQQVASLQWNIPRDESGIDGYATIVNQVPDFDPTVRNLESNTTMLTVSLNEDGVSYFHIRAIDRAGNYSRTVHYPLRMTRNPLPLPDVESPTHPEGQAVAANEAMFSWKQFGGERVKGFLYSLTRDTLGRPETFTTMTETDFTNLDDGRYFFAVQPVDRLNRGGRIAVYEIIVGSAAPLDPAEYERIARNTTPENIPAGTGGALAAWYPSGQWVPPDPDTGDQGSKNGTGTAVPVDDTRLPFLTEFEGWLTDKTAAHVLRIMAFSGLTLLTSLLFGLGSRPAFYVRLMQYRLGLRLKIMFGGGS